MESGGRRVAKRGAVVQKDDELIDQASEAVLRSGLAGLTPADRIRLWNYARVRLAACAAFAEGREPQDLVSEAVFLTWAGERPWRPHKVRLLNHLFGCIKSLASHLPERYHDDRRNVPVGQAGQRDLEGEFGVDGWAAGAPDPSASAMDRYHLHQVLMRIEQEFAADPELLRFFHSVAEHAGVPAPGRSIQAELGITLAKYRALQERFRRRVQRLF
jgi:hypothetical protein